MQGPGPRLRVQRCLRREFRALTGLLDRALVRRVIDFVNVMPGTPKSKVKSRLILTPQHAKRFMKALTENVVRFEAANGKIQDLEEAQLPLNFGGPTAQA